MHNSRRDSSATPCVLRACTALWPRALNSTISGPQVDSLSRYSTLHRIRVPKILTFMFLPPRTLRLYAHAIALGHSLAIGPNGRFVTRTIFRAVQVPLSFFGSMEFLYEIVHFGDGFFIMIFFVVVKEKNVSKFCRIGGIPFQVDSSQKFPMMHPIVFRTTMQIHFFTIVKIMLKFHDCWFKRCQNCRIL